MTGGPPRLTRDHLRAKSKQCRGALKQMATGRRGSKPPDSVYEQAGINAIVTGISEGGFRVVDANLADPSRHSLDSHCKKSLVVKSTCFSVTKEIPL